MIVLLGFLSLILGGLGRRIAGGVLNQWFTPIGGRVMGDTPARLLYGAMVALPLCPAFTHAPWWVPLATIPSVWVGTTTGNWRSMAMGHASTSLMHDLLGMSAHAALSAILPVAIAAYVVHWYALIALVFIMMAAPLYWLGWEISPSPTGNPKLPLGFRGGSELGEFFWGAATGLGLFLAYAV